MDIRKGVENEISKFSVPTNWGLAQMVERFYDMEKAVGSLPTSPTKKRRRYITINKLDISKILVNNKYRLDLTKDDISVSVVDIPKCADLILELIDNGNENRGISTKTLDEQIVETEKEYYNYSRNKFSSPIIVEWLENVLNSLKELRELKK